jgi:hypothetical protein
MTPEPIDAGSRFPRRSADDGAWRRHDGRVHPVQSTQTPVLDLAIAAARSTRTTDADGGRLTFEPIPAGIEMRWSWQVETPSPMKLLAPLITFLGRRQERRIWNKLKRLLEQQASE